MARAIHKLTAREVETIVKQGRHSDGGGLYLFIDANGAKRWMLRTVIRGKRCDVGLGSASLVTLASAREQARQMRATARAGDDPLLARRAQRQVVPTFKEAATTVHADHKAGWRNPKHAAQWLATLAEHAFPLIGDRPVDRIATTDVLRVLSPIWLEKPETARRIRQRIAVIMDWAKASGFTAGDNPVEGVTKGLPKQRAAASHHKAMPYEQVGDFVRRLQAGDASEPVRLAFELLILTAARTGEIVGARWEEVDLENAAWTIPASRMKANRDHRVPLSDRAVAILTRAREIGGGGPFVFPGRSVDQPISNMAFLMALRRMGESVTAHGFRSSFRDWSAEKTSFPRDVCEMALAHTIRDKTEAAYRRGDLFAKRRQLMSSWSRHVCTATSNVVRFVS